MNIMHGCGNTFAVYDEIAFKPIPEKARTARSVCAKEELDGMIFVSREEGRVRMRIFDRDGTEETMCGNGIRCCAKYAFDQKYITTDDSILTGDGEKRVAIRSGEVAVNMGQARKTQQLSDNTFFTFTGVAHVVMVVPELAVDAARELGRLMRNDPTLTASVGHPEGVNVNFVKIIDERTIQIMTYEMGVEDVTLACGTGSTAAAHIAHAFYGCTMPLRVQNLGGPITISIREGNLMMQGDASYGMPDALKTVPAPRKRSKH